MASKRMIKISLIDSDLFLDMPVSSQSLYFHLMMRADDDGFLTNARRLLRYLGNSEDDLKMLFAKGFCIAFESGVIVITHWKQCNSIAKDRYKPTLCSNEKQLLKIGKDLEYILKTQEELDCTEEDIVIEQIETVVEEPKKETKEVKKKEVKKEVKHKHGECQNVLLTDEEYSKLAEKFTDYKEKINNLSYYIASKGVKYKSHYLTILNWARKDNGEVKSSNTYKKPSVKENLDDAYNMMAEWAGEEDV